MTPLLEAKQLTKRYGSTIALESVDLKVYEGITGLLGANGAGKSTAIKLFLGLLKPTSGTAEVMGQESFESVEVRACLGYMPEHDCLPSSLSAAEFLTHMAEVSRLPTIHARTRAADVLRHVGLAEERYRALGGYSTGMKQRVKLAQALVHDPTIVLLDEPTAGLDPRGREEMLDLIWRTGKECGISLLLSSHLMGDIEHTCDRIIVLEGGHVMEEGAVSGLTSETQTILIELETKRNEVLGILKGQGIKATVEGSLIVVELEGEEQYDAMRDAIVGAEARLRRLTPRRHTLSEVFQDTAS
ncbi:MAG: ABC transporter ATP-binding protein [Chloroflexota bacterium]|nr:ABC transporter ATP-binding protein [Chloroflexota bacterium]